MYRVDIYDEVIIIVVLKAELESVRLMALLVFSNLPRRLAA